MDLWYVETYDRINHRWFRYADKLPYEDARRTVNKLYEAGWKVRLRKVVE